jgi:hypothetical protein
MTTSRIGVDLEPIDLTDARPAPVPPETKSLERFDRAARLVAADPALVTEYQRGGVFALLGVL